MLPSLARQPIFAMGLTPPQRAQEEATFDPVVKKEIEETDDCQVDSQEAFNKASLEAVYTLLALIQEKWADITTDRELFHEVNAKAAQLRLNLAVKAEKTNAQDYGTLRENVPGGFFLKVLGKGMPYPKLGEEIIDHFKPYPFLEKNLSDQGPCQLRMHVREPESMSDRITLATQQRKAAELAILQACSCLAQLKNKQGKEGMALLKANETLNPDCLQNKDLLQHPFFVGELFYLEQDEPEVPLSTYVSILKKGNDKYYTDAQIGIISPQVTLASYHVLGRALGNVLRWDKQDVTVFIQLMARFSFLYSHIPLQKEGTSWCLQVITKALYKFHGFKLVRYAPSMRPDLKALVHPYPLTYAKMYPSFFAEIPTHLQDTSNLASRLQGTEKYKGFSVAHLKSKIVELIDRFSTLHHNSLDELLASRLSRQRMAARKKRQTNEPTLFDLRDHLEKQALSFHTAQKIMWSELKKAVEKGDENVFNKLVEECMILIEKNKQVSDCVITDCFQFSNKTRQYILNFTTFKGELPKFVSRGEQPGLYSVIAAWARSSKLAIPVDYLSLTTIQQNVSQLSAETFAKLREQTRAQYVKESDKQIQMERYILDGEDHFYVRYPFTTNIEDDYVLVNIFTNTYPDYFKNLSAFHIGRDRLLSMIEDEKNMVNQLYRMFAVLQEKEKNDTMKISAASPKPAAPKFTDSIPSAPAETAKTKGKKKKSKPAATGMQTPPMAKPAAATPPVRPHLKAMFADPTHAETFSVLTKRKPGKVTWEEVVACLKALGFTVDQTGGNLFKFKFHSEATLIQQSGPLDDYDEYMGAMGTIGMPHRRGGTSGTPLSDQKIQLFRELLERAGFDAESLMRQENN